jgi:hypothetical protein
MQDNTNQTDQKEPDNRGQNGHDVVSERLRSLWCAREDLNLHEHKLTNS